ncbi:hypothetical protein VTI28DRAFT_9738 [Corynascus sepedonium]
MNTAGAVILALVLLLIAAGIGWVVFTRIRAARLGLPPPPLKSYIPFLSFSSNSYGGSSPAQGGGIFGWIGDKVRTARNKRTAVGAYEGSGGGGVSSRYAGAAGRNPLRDDDDDPWDSRVGGYNPYEEDEERELGPMTSSAAAGGRRGPGYAPDGEGYQMNLAVPAAEDGAGAAGGRGGGVHDEEEGRGRTRSRSPGPSSSIRTDPFGDEAEPSNLSMRGVSPRPVEGVNASFAARKAAGEDHDRRSMFREDI